MSKHMMSRPPTRQLHPPVRKNFKLRALPWKQKHQPAPTSTKLKNQPKMNEFSK
jgi:hypothetical protein